MAISPSHSRRSSVSSAAPIPRHRGVGLQSSSTAIIGNVAGTLSHEFPRGLQLSVQVGPSFIRTDEEDLPGTTIPEFDIFNLGNGVIGARAIDFSGGACFSNALDLQLACPIVQVPAGTALPTNGLVTLAAPTGADAAGASETDISYFAEVRLVKNWDKSRADLSYTRDRNPRMADRHPLPWWTRLLSLFATDRPKRPSSIYGVNGASGKWSRMQDRVSSS